MRDTWPTSEHQALTEFLSATKARSRALKRKCAVVECASVAQQQDDQRWEGVELLLGRDRRGALRVRFRIWQDRWCWFDARRSSKQGWVFEWTSNGRLVGGLSAPELVTTIEKAYDLAHADDAAQRLEALWLPVLMRGPRRI